MSGKSFRFSLDPVLHLRKHEAEMARRILQRAVAARTEAEQVVEAAEELLSRRLAGTGVTGAMGGQAVRQLAGFREDAHRSLERARQRLHELKRAEDEARRRLIERRRDEETLEQLRDVERGEFIRAADVAEAAFSDEQALNGFIRKQHPAQR